MRRRAEWAIALGLLLLAPEALASQGVLRVADPSGAGHVVAEFVSKEIAAVVLGAAHGDYPMLLRRATVRVGASVLSTRGHTGQGSMRLWIWRDVGATEPGPVVYEGRTLVDVLRGENTFEITSEGIVVESGNLRVGFEVGVEGADVLVDENGMTSGRNFVLGKQTGTTDTFRWQALPSSLLAGDFLITLEVETRVDGGLPAADAGAPVDAGAPADAGPPPDAGTPPDAGVRPDAGTGGPSADGGLIRHPSSDCLCGGGGGGWPALPILLGLWWRTWRRRARSSRGRHAPR
jgi:hypothetical protein